MTFLNLPMPLQRFTAWISSAPMHCLALQWLRCPAYFSSCAVSHVIQILSRCPLNVPQGSPHAHRKKEEELEREKRKRDAELQKWMNAAAGESDGEGSDYSPVLMQGGDAEAEDIEQDEREQKRRKLEFLTLEKKKAVENEKMQMSAAKDMGLDDKLLNGEALFSEEVDVKHKWYAYYDKYRPRKPKYFNRVHTGYQWNKYNSTHYDYDNPPPKVVMGYKFNIFYPDLVDPGRQQPTYFVEATEKGWDDDVCLIRFHAGPPYEDIAFKIVNKKWEYSNRRGFRCTFERGVLHLYFNFINYRYRR